MRTPAWPLALSLLLAACGGKVVVDDVEPPVPSCEDICNKSISACGGSAAECASSCAQTEQILKNIQRALEQLGGTMADVVQVIVFVKDMEGLRAIHEARLRYFSPPYPTSTLVAVSAFVHPDALIEINAVAALKV